MKKSLSSLFTSTFTPHSLSIVGALFSIALLGVVSSLFSVPIALLCICIIAVSIIIIKTPLFGLYGIAFFLPFERVGAIDISGMTVRPSQIFLLLTVLALSFEYLSKKRKIFPTQPLLIPFILFIIVGLLGLWNAPYIERSVLVLLFQIFTFCVTLVVPILVRNKKILVGVLTWFFAGTVIVSLFGLFQFVGDWLNLPETITLLRPLYTKEILGFPRIQSTALEPLYFANYLLFPLSLVVALFLDRTAHIKRSLIVAGIILISTNMLLTVARGAYIAAAVMILVLSLFFIRSLFQKRVVIAAVILLSLSMVITPIISQKTSLPTLIAEHVKNIFGGASYVERVDMFVIAQEAWQKHPFIGIGSGSFGPYQSQYIFEQPREGWKIVNNEYLELLAENGIFGLIIILFIFGFVFMRSLKAIQRSHDRFVTTITIASFAACIGILVQYNTFSILYIMHIWFLVGMMIALQNIVLERSHNDEKERKR